MPARATESVGGFRRYRYRGREFVSVTTILSNGVPKQGPLVGWAAKTVAQWAVDNLEEVNRLAARDPEDAVNILKGAHYKAKKSAGLRGTEIHALAEAYAKGEPLPPVSPGALPYVRPLMEFLDDFKPEPVLVEKTAFSLEHGYAGTFDSIATFDALGTCVLDWKTSKGVYGETALQLAAYAWADGYDDGSPELAPLPKLDGGLVVHISPTGYALFKADISRPVFDAFLAVKAVAEFMTVTSKQVLAAI